MISYCSAEEAVSLIDSGERIFIHGGAATPQRLVDALTHRHEELRNIEIVHIHTEGIATYADPKYKKSFHVNSFFIGENIRAFVDHTNVQYVPVFLSEIPKLFRNEIFPLDTAIIHVSAPDKHGFCSLGVSVDIAKAATDKAKKIIALVNPRMPRSHGDGQIHSSRFSAAVYAEDEIPEVHTREASQTELLIGKNIASLIDDGATIQMGIGAIPNSVTKFLEQHKNLGIHTEMFTDSILPLVEKGIINGIKKRNTPEKLCRHLFWGQGSFMILSMITQWLLCSMLLM